MRYHEDQMTIAIAFTKAALAELQPQNAHYHVKDSNTPGLILRVHSGGMKTFMFFRRIDGRLKRVKIGRFGDITVEMARKAAIQINSTIIAGLDDASTRSELTFGELFDKYYNQHALIHTKRPEDNKATLEFHLMPKIKDLKVSKVTTELLTEHHLAQGSSRGKQQANRVLTIVSAAYNFGIRKRLIRCSNPCIGIKRFKSRSRDRFLSNNELQLFFKELKVEDQLYQDFFMLCVFIGARKSTMLAMRYDQIDFDLCRFRLSEDESKNDDVNIYVVPNVAIEILKRRLESNKLLDVPSEFVFPSDSASGHLSDPKRAFKRIKDRMGIKNLWIHDLRRTLGSHMAINNTSLQIIGQALNHKSHASTQIYARLTYQPILQAVNEATNIMIQGSIRRNGPQYMCYSVSPHVKFGIDRKSPIMGYAFRMTSVK